MTHPVHPPQHGTAAAIALIKEPAALPRLTNEEFRVITESALDGIVVMDNYGRVTHWNPAAEKIFGWKAEEMLGKSIHDTITPPEFRKMAYKGIANFMHTGRGPLLESMRTVRGLRKDGMQFPLEIALSSFKIEGNWWATAFVRDVTERHEAEQEMRNYATALEEVNQKLREMRQKAEEAAESKSRFLANMSHEIRTPLNGIMGFTAMLLDTDLNGEQSDYTGTIYKSGELLLETINNILDFSKIEAGQLQLEEVNFNLKSVIGNLVALLSIKSNEKKIKLLMKMDPQVPLLLQGDPLRISQILLNLMSNAVKFTDTGQVVVEVHVDQVTPHKVDLRIHISDTGIGIPADRRDSLFEPFMQVDTSTTRKFGGTGLGLTICSHLVKLMGGQINVFSPAITGGSETEENRSNGNSSKSSDRGGPGSTFAVSLSLLRQAEIEGKPMQQEVSELSGQFDRQLWQREPIHARALIAEDNPVNQKLLSQMLKKFGLETVTVENGQEAITALKDGAFDILMMDFEMPLLNGVEATRLIRSGEPLVDASIPIVILTAHAMKEDRMLCIASGANEYLTKPFHPGMIYKTIAKLLGQGGNDRSLCAINTKSDDTKSDDTKSDDTKSDDTKSDDTKADERSVYDAQGLLEQCGNDQDLVDELVDIFLKTQEEMVAATAESIQQGTPELIVEAAHKLKGSLNALHADEASEAAARLETIVQDGSGEAALRSQFAELQAKLQTLLQQMQSIKL